MDTAFTQPDTGVPGLPAPLAAQDYRDRGAGMVIFGILLIVLAGFTLLLMPLVLLGAAVAHRAGGALPVGNYVLTLVGYGLAAVVFLTLGIGSIRARRWARALVLITSWFWAVSGVLVTFMLTAVLPRTFMAAFRQAAERTPGAQPLSPGVLAVILTIVIAMFAVFLVVLPIIFVAFYGRKDVEETCRRRDPVERWTDRRPLPVIAASLMFAVGALYCVLMSFTTPLVPFFGRYLTGLVAGLLLLVFAGIDGVVSYLLFRRLMAGWWLAVVLACLRFVSSAATFRRGDLLQAYSKMGWSQEQLRVMSANPAMRSGMFLWWSLGFVLVFLGYLIWIRKYFVAPEAGRAILEGSQQAL